MVDMRAECLRGEDRVVAADERFESRFEFVRDVVGRRKFAEERGRGLVAAMRCFREEKVQSAR